jgi:hypothetical protein
MKRIISAVLIISFILMGLFFNKMLLAKWVVLNKIVVFENDIRFSSSLLPMYPLYIKSQDLVMKTTSNGKSFLDPSKALGHFEELDEYLQLSLGLVERVAPYNSETEQIKETIRLMLGTINSELPRSELKKLDNFILLPFVDFDYLIESTTSISNTLEAQYENLELHSERYQVYLQNKLGEKSNLSTGLLLMFNNEEKLELIHFLEEHILNIANENQDFFEVYDDVLLLPFKEKVHKIIKETVLK